MLQLIVIPNLFLGPLEKMSSIPLMSSETYGTLHIYSRDSKAALVFYDILRIYNYKVLTIITIYTGYIDIIFLIR